MPVAWRALVKAQLPYTRVDFEIVYNQGLHFGEQWFVYDVESGFLLSLGAPSAYLAWKVAYANINKILGFINKDQKAVAILP